MSICTYQITLTPALPYFFGNEKSFVFPGSQANAYGNSSSYFIKSEDTPAQSALLGVLRYVLLPHKWGDANYSQAESDTAIGQAGFDITKTSAQDYGKIQRLSPLFLTDGRDLYVPVPFNHKVTPHASDTPQPYQPFAEYHTMETCRGTRLYTADYNAKAGLPTGYLNVTDGTVHTDLISSTQRVGIQRNAREEGFFKKEYKMLKKGYAFTFYADIDGDVAYGSYPVFLGQGKSPFSLKIEKSASAIDSVIQTAVKPCLSAPAGKRLLYCLSDCVVSESPADSALFAVYAAKDYRSFKTGWNGSGKTVCKGTELYHPVQAGSVFIIDDDRSEALCSLFHNENAQKIGFNTVVLIGG